MSVILFNLVADLLYFKLDPRVTCVSLTRRSGRTPDRRAAGTVAEPAAIVAAPAGASSAGRSCGRQARSGW